MLSTAVCWAWCFSLFYTTIAIKNYVLWKGIFSLPFRRSFPSLASLAECLKTEMSLFFHFPIILWHHRWWKERKKEHRASYTKNMLKGKNEKVFKDYEKTIFCAPFVEAWSLLRHLCILKDFAFPSVVEGEQRWRATQKINIPLDSHSHHMISVGESSEEFVSMFKVFRGCLRRPPAPEQQKTRKKKRHIFLCLSKWKNGIIRAWNKNEDIEENAKSSRTQTAREHENRMKFRKIE